MAKGGAEVKELPIFTYYDVQRFKQFSGQDCANWYLVNSSTGKRKYAMYPCMGRRHIQNTNGLNVLEFGGEPRAIWKSINYMYVVVGSTIYKVDSNFSKVALQNSDFNQLIGFLSFDYLPLVEAVGSASQVQSVYVGICDGNNFYIINEDTNDFTTITDTNTPANPTIVKAFGNRFVVSSANSTEFRLTQINCYDITTSGFNAASLFTVPGSGSGGKAVFAQESGIIRQMAVLHNTLYIFTDFDCGIWSNIPSTIGGNTSSSASSIFPWKKNTSINWDYGIADPNSLSVNFGRMCWLARNRNGLIEFMQSNGQMPTSISTQAISSLLQQEIDDEQFTSFANEAEGFLYQYENNIFYRVSSGNGIPTNEFISGDAYSLEYNFNTKTWQRCIEFEGIRNLIKKHVYFNKKHIVSVIGQNSLYQMGGRIYINEIRNTDVEDLQSPLAYIAYPMRYELVTSIISQDFYQEFKTNWLQIDFVFGEQTFINSNVPFQNTVFIVAEDSTDSNPIYMVAEDDETFIITEDGNTPSLDEATYNSLFKPHIELLVSDDGGITFWTADVLEFSQLGKYSWRMRWYQLGSSRNRVYKLVCISPSPITVLGAIQETEIVSGGAY